MAEREEQCVPKLRFPGFEGEWQEYRLGSISDIRTGSSNLQDADPEGEFPFFVRSENIERSNHWLYDGEAILIPGEGRIGEVFHYINGKFDYHQRVYKISDFEEDRVFGLFTLYHMQRFFKKHALLYSVKATVDSLRMPIIKEYKILSPSLEEQRQIGNFFKALDDEIQTTKEKIEQLTQLKQGLLQQLFPQTGEDKPRLRFPGFSGEWGHYRLGDVSDIKTGSSDLQDANPEGEFPFFVRSENIERSNRWLYDGEAILIPGEGRIGEVFHYVNGKFDYHQRVYKISDFEENRAFGLFTLYHMQRFFKQHVSRYSVKATVDSLRMPIVKEYKILLPSLEEQHLIGSLFRYLDQYITETNQKLHLLNRQKQALLQQLFI